MHSINHRNALMAAMLALCAAAWPVVAPAQGLSDPEAIDTIIGSEVHEEETRAEADPARVIAAIERNSDYISAVRKVTALDRIDIVYLADSGVTEGGPPAEVDAKISEYQSEISELRTEIEGNAMLYHALDSRQILPRDVVALEFGEAKDVIIFAAAKPPAR
ncbi:MAG: hypothetical protein AB7I79_02930 [Rhizobiaceae bacterium]